LWWQEENEVLNIECKVRCTFQGKAPRFDAAGISKTWETIRKCSLSLFSKGV
jgi:hypothetical protein